MKKIIGIVSVIVIILGCTGTPANVTSGSDELDLAIRDASDYLNDNIPEGSMIVILNIQSDSAVLSDYIIDELIANAVNDRIFTVVDRQQLDLIRSEQNFQLSGEVDDNLALSIGRFFGAQTIVSGRVSQVADRYRMTIRALNVQTAHVQGQYNRNIPAGRTITALMRSGGGSTGTGQTTTARTTGGTSTGVPSPDNRIIPTVTSVTVNPDNISVDKGRTQQFEATIIGNNNPDPSVTWTVSGNLSRGTSINEDGILIVADDEIATPLTVTATSTVDQSKNGRVTVLIPGGISAINVNNVSTWNSAVNTIRNGGNNQNYIISISGNISVPAPPSNETIFGSVTGIMVTIQGSGTLALSVSGSLLRIAAGQTVVVRNVTLRGRSDNNRSLIIINNGGILRLEGNASITGNRLSANMTSRDGGDGGGVRVEGGTFIMQDNASVTGNSVHTTGGSGAGIYITSGTFIMQSGTISGNTATTRGSGGGDGGGVYVGRGGTFIMESGTISGNTSAPGRNGTGGGGVYVRGTFTMKGGTISGNTSRNHGGAVIVGGGVLARGGTFNMQGGTISGGNNASGYGGGVYVNEGTLNKTGGIISGNDASFGERNTATRQGHALYWTSRPARWRNATAEASDNTADFGFWLND